MTPGQRLRQLANVLNGSTALGLLLAGLARTRTVGGPRGLVIATGYGWRLPFAGAFAVGNVIIYRAGPDAAFANPVLLQHEERHSTQYAWCLGAPFLVFYFLAAVWSVLRNGDPASGNLFERRAGLEAGGYVDRRRNRSPRRPPRRTAGPTAGRTTGGNAGGTEA
ncbi:hypothetical protein ASG92_20150 [Arthrobacter sp. Soil736]|uniref:hypothetical protein n=1 Tax=Arthrobacter sp. Soil736 TaxID=1736395 RepID=UPI0006FF5457|nr:hypothetical protein [Arthrobacter sp. Soil736]KRE61862.1 hypothetical protein ASG92_20150 [Arthrobacter sp. Soil736]